MPVRHATQFMEKKCPDTYEQRLRIPGCALPQKPFEPVGPNGRPVKPKPQPSPSPTPQPTQVLPW